ncbi:TPA: hypothetical protein ACMV04_004014, partial [Salmonella enterica subsp. enterica]
KFSLIINKMTAAVRQALAEEA